MLNSIKQLSIIGSMLLSITAYSDVTLYGPGGPHTALLDVAKAFEEKEDVKVHVNFGPQTTWQAKAQENADILFGPSQQSALAIINDFKANFNVKDMQSLYLHDAIILVQKGNPKKITTLEDLIKPNIKIAVIDGQGVSNTSGTGVWEDIVGRKQDVAFIQAFRNNIEVFAINCGSAFKAFKNKDVDAWITWRDWALSNPEAGDVVNINDDYVITRDFNIVVNQNNTNPEVNQFVNYLKTSDAQAIFANYGWYFSK